MKRATIAWVAAAAFGAGCGERPNAEYATHAEAVAAGAIERGWLPRWLPADATRIVETHDLDTNEVCIRFELPAERRAAVFGPMRMLSDSEIETLARSCTLRPNWWFSNLIQQEPTDDGALYADVLAAPGTPPNHWLLVALDRLGPAIYVWSSGSR